MKRIILFFAVCLGLSVSQTTFAADSSNTRTTAKRTTATTVSTNANSNRTIASEAKRSDTPQTKSNRTAAKINSQKAVNRTQANQNIKTRSTSSTKNVVQRTTSRTATTNRTLSARKSASTNNDGARSATYSTPARRAVALNETKMAEIKSANYSSCKNVYYECMDEFCAHKDANLGRCACSSRIHEFDNIKRQLDEAEDKMLDFNQRLLTVSLEKEDAAAINTATEGELAFQKKDKSKSEKTLQKISKNLNSSSDSKISNDIASFSLNLDTAWDDVNSFAGVSTTSKSGLDLYNAARPICVEMAKEVCFNDELKIAQEGYKVTIQQDCDTVAKSYKSIYNNAMAEINNSSALLDMARLDIYQQRNSDNTLTCKKKIINQLSNTSVCGTDLHKCLDMTGEYIDPSTGKAFLSENLYNLSTLLQEPTGNQKWSKISKNEKFVAFLKSKKKFLEPAMEQCQDIADTIWNEFLDDALAQIKLAQLAKLEEIKLSCTELVTDCKTNALKDLSEFDSRALSVFSVAANKTANEMCKDVQNSCVSLMNVDTSHDWSEGMADIATDITYDTIIDTCTEIGHDCIIQKCNGTSGNFALCTNLISDNRIAILKRDACWTEVLNCVRSADNLENMKHDILSYNRTDLLDSREQYYDALYANTEYDRTNMPTFCVDENNDPLSGTELIACLIAEQIWGNCETNNNDNAITSLGGIANSIEHNRILIPNTGSTLLSWFADQTDTDAVENYASCSTYGCPVNHVKENGACRSLINETTQDCGYVTNRNQILNVIINALTNFCATGVRDAFGNCCASASKNNGICVPNNTYKALNLMTTTCDVNACDGLTTETRPKKQQCLDTIPYYCPENTQRQIYVYCITTGNYIMYDVSDGYSCDNGFWMMIDQYGNYFEIEPNSNASFIPSMTYRQQCSSYDTVQQSCPVDTPVCGSTCQYSYNTGNEEWSFGSCNNITDHPHIPESNEFMITYQH
jgi:hypothetical protein